MDPEQVKMRVTSIFRDTFDDDAIVLREDMTARDLKGWDSVSHIRLMLSIEEAFKFRFSSGEISDLHNVGELLEAIQGRLR
jgi:acyl carrier protein